MIDKLELEYDEQYLVPLTIYDVRTAAQQNSLTIIPVTDMRERGIFMRVAEHPSIYFKINPDQTIERVYANPSHFSSLREFLAIMTALERGSGVVGNGVLNARWLDACTIVRIDYAIRYRRPFPDIMSGVDVRWRQQRREIQRTSNATTGIYFGALPDQVAVYDESTYYRRRVRRRRLQTLVAPELANQIEQGATFTKVERQMRQRRNIGDFAQSNNIIENSVSFRNLETHLRDIIEGEVRPFEHLVIQQVSVRSAGELRDIRQQRRADELRGALRMSSYGDVRRSFGQSRNFHRLYRPLLNLLPLPEDENPENLLKNSLRRFLGMATPEPQNDNPEPQIRPRRRATNRPAHPRRRPSQNNAN